MLHRTIKSYDQHHHHHRPKFRSGFHNHHQPHHHQSSTANNNRKPYIQAHIKFFDNNGDDGGAGALKLNKYQTDNLNQRQNKWPNLSRLQSKLKEDIIDGELPPYIKKYNRRNKQLINLLEGTISPNYNHKKILQRRRQKNTNKWLEKYLFEEQKPIKSANQQQQQQQQHKSQEYVIGKHAQVEPNELPGEYVTVSADLADEDDDTNDNNNNNANSKNNNNNNDDNGNSIDGDDNAVSNDNTNNNNKNSRIGSTSNNINKVYAERPISDKATVRQQPFDERHSNQTKISNHKRDQFLFHRVAAPKLVGMGAMEYGARKQRLPFVAITDKRVGEVKQRLDNMQAAAANLPPSP